MRRKYIPFISILILAMFFGTAATCNMCGLNLTTEATTKAIEESQTDNTSAQVSETEETTKVTIAEDTNKEKITDTTKSSSTDSQAIAPTIKLQIYEGPTYSQADDVYYYRIEAVVTGSPAPDVIFSRDDSNGSLGKYKAQINLKLNETYTLTAEAKNSSGEETATLDLVCEVTDSYLHPTILGTVGPAGYFDANEIYIADSPFNSDWRGRFAFDLSNLAGKEILFATLILDNPYLYGDPCSFKGDIVIFYNDFLPDLTADDYYSTAYAGPETFACNAEPLKFSSDFLIEKVKERANSNTELQFGIGYTNKDSNMDNNIDGRFYDKYQITLRVLNV